MIFKAVALFLTALICLPLQAETFKFRARENYEVLNLKNDQDRKATYRGFSNTFNLFYEKPFDYSFGLAAGSILSGFSTSDVPLNGFDEDIRIYFIGVEAKLFPLKFRFPKQGFTRVGAYWTTIDTDGTLGQVNGFNLYGGFGYEFLVAEQTALAPEFGFRVGKTEGLKSYNALVFSLGIHFYGL